MALQNINTYENIVREHIFDISPLKWEDQLENKKNWLKDEFVPILNEV